MRMHSIALSVVAMLEVGSARAKPCQLQDLLDQAAKLPSFIIIPAGSTPDDVLRQALPCNLPPPPTFAGGERALPKEVVGHQVFAEDGKHIGSVTGVALDQNTWKTALVMTSASTDTTYATPVDEFTFDAKKAGLVTSGSNENDLKKHWVLGSNVAVLGSGSLSAFGWCLMCPYPSMVPIDIMSDPPGGTIFIEEQARGNTELQGLIATSKEQTIRIEYPKRKSCQFADGTFTPPQATGAYAKFFCKLTR